MIYGNQEVDRFFCIFLYLCHVDHSSQHTCFCAGTLLNFWCDFGLLPYTFLWLRYRQSCLPRGQRSVVNYGLVDESKVKPYNYTATN